jgi:hypothetical protein
MVSVAPTESVTVAVKVSVPVAVGVPVIEIDVPDEGKVTPGKAFWMFVMAIEWDPVPPLAVIV